MLQLLLLLPLLLVDKQSCSKAWMVRRSQDPGVVHYKKGGKAQGQSWHPSWDANVSLLSGMLLQEQLCSAT